MDKEEFKRQRQITLKKQEQFLVDNPKIGKWVKMKNFYSGFLQDIGFFML